MRSLHLLVAIAVIVALLAYWWVSTERPDSTSAPLGHGPATESASSPAINEDLGDPHAPRKPIAGTGDRRAAPAARRPLLREELQALVKLTDSWPPNEMRREFSEVDMRALRDRVVALGVTENDLMELVRASTQADPLRTVLLASFAFVPHMGDESRSLVVTAVQAAYPDYGMKNGSPPPKEQLAACYAGVFSLQMHDAEQHLQAIALDALQLYDGMNGSNSALRNVAALALLDIGAGASTELVNTVKRALAAPPEGVLTSALYGALAQIGDAADLDWIVDRAIAREPLSRGGLEAMKDPRMVGSLEVICTSVADVTVDKVYGEYLATSAARGLLSIGTEEALIAYKKIALSSDAGQWTASWKSLEPNPPPVVAGSLARIAMLAREADHPIKDALGSALNNTKLRLMRCTVSEKDRRVCAGGIRDVLPELTQDKHTLRAALEVLAIAGDKEDEQYFQSFLDGLSVEERNTLLALWDASHPIALD
jgi:hypothetical protein